MIFEVSIPVNSSADWVCPILLMFASFEQAAVCLFCIGNCALLLRLSFLGSLSHRRPLIGGFISSAKTSYKLFTWFTVNHVFQSSDALILSPSIGDGWRER